MKITVIGAGAIGNLVAGYLKLKNEDISLVGHSESVRAIRRNGLSIQGVRGNFNVNIDIFEKLQDKPDLVILAVKTQDIEGALKDNLSFLKDILVLTTQNGVSAEALVSEYIPKENIISSIIMFGSTYLEPAKVVHNFDGKWIIGKMFCPNDERVNEIQHLLNEIFPTLVSDNIRGMKYLKIFINANNCIAAILGVSMQEAFSDLDISRISIAIWKEGLNIIKKSGIDLISLPDFPLERLTELSSMPILEAAKIFSGIMVNLSKEPLYGSILQSIKRGRPSEIDYINGEFVNLAKNNNIDAPLNEKLVEMVHNVEKTNKFYSRKELILQTQKFVN
jgi:2-dehydropantoate 2-reductase